MKSDKKRVIEYIDRNAEGIVDFLCEFIGKKSINLGTPATGDELEAQDWLKRRFHSMGFDQVDYWFPDPEQKRPNLVGKIGGGKKGKVKSLIFQGHVDVVPVPDSELGLWKSDPWKGTARDGNVFGRGASDTKGGISAMIWAARALIDCGISLEGDVLVETVIGEESQEGETIGAAATVKRGHKADFAIVAEPTNAEIHTESPGVFLFELTVPGKSAHTASRNQVLFPQRCGIESGPAVGVDAIEKMTMFLDLFRRLEIQWNHRWRSKVLGGGGYPIPRDKQGVGLFTINPSFIEGGTYLGSVPGYCKLTANVWYPSWMTVEEIIKELDERVQSLARTDDWLRENPPQLKAPVLQCWRPFKVDVDFEGVKTLALSFEEASGHEAVHSGFKATCDATWLNENGIPSVTFGPGGLELGVHGPNEHVPIDELILCTKVYALTAINWCGGANG
jgi:acetylornithine deacetylase